MSRGSLRKTAKRFSGGIPVWAICILFVISLLAAWSVGEVYARYATSGDSDDTGNVASVGIESFELFEHGNGVESIDYTKVVPGADIPGPHVKLKIDAQVNYTLYVKVTSVNFPPADGDGNEVQTVSYSLSETWRLVNTTTEQKGNDKYTVSTYEYIVGTEGENTDCVFKAGTPYEMEIKILKDDVIYISQYYDPDTTKFTLAFEAYLRQIA